MVLAAGAFGAAAAYAQPRIDVPARASLERQFEVESKAQWSVGGTMEDPDREFAHRNGFLTATVTSSGIVIVFDVTRIHFIDSRSGRQRIVGRRGAGPNEFTSLFAGCVTRGDTVVAYDVALRRVTILSVDGRIVRQFSVSNMRPMSNESCLAEGTVAFQESGALENGQGVGRAVQLDLFGAIKGAFGSLPTGNTAAPSRIVGTTRGALLADPRKPELREVDGSGQVLRTIRLLEPREAIRSAADVPGGLVARQGGSSAPPPAGTTGPGFGEWPYFDRIVNDLIGRLWIERFQRLATDDGEWTLLDAGGRALGLVRIPRKLSSAPRPILLTADSAGVILLRRDVDGAAVVSRHALADRSRR